MCWGSIEWWHCRWPWITPTRYHKPPHFLHSASPFLSSEWTKVDISNVVHTLNITNPSLWQIVPLRDVVRVTWPIIKFLGQWTTTRNASTYKHDRSLSFYILVLLLFVQTIFRLIIMAALWAGRYRPILPQWFLSSSSFFFLFFFAYSQRSYTGCLPYFHTWFRLSANIECRSEMCCTRLAENTGRKNSPKIRHLRTIEQLCRAIPSQIRHQSTIRKKVKQQYLFHMSSQYGELRPINGWDRLTSFGHPSKFRRVSRLGFVTAPMSLNGSQPNFGRLLSWYAYTLYYCF